MQNYFRLLSRAKKAERSAFFSLLIFHPFLIFLIIFSMKEGILQKHFLKRSLIPYGKTAMRKLVVAFLMHDSIDDVEEHFLVRLNRFRTNGTAQSADDLEHLDPSSLVNLSPYLSVLPTDVSKFKTFSNINKATTTV